MRTLPALLLVGGLGWSIATAQDPADPSAAPFRLVPITQEQVTNIMTHLAGNMEGIPLDRPLQDLNDAMREVAARFETASPRRVAQHGDWVFFPRLDQKQDDLSFDSGWALSIGRREMIPWDTQAVVLGLWDFEKTDDSRQQPLPKVGTGTVELLGGLAADFQSGAAVHNRASRKAWNTSGYPGQGTGSGERGVRVNVDTTGFSSIVVQFDHRSSKTGSRWARLDYTVDGRTFTPYWTNNGALSPPDRFRTYRFELGDIPQVADNPRFGFRVVSIFSPRPFQQNEKSGLSAANTAYMRASEEASYEPWQAKGKGNYGGEGSWRFDNIMITGVPLPARDRMIYTGRVILGSVAAAALIAAGLLAWRRKLS